MEFPHRHGHGHRRDDDDDDKRRGSAYGRPDADAPPYGGSGGYGQPPPPSYGRPDADPAPYGGGYGQQPPPNYGRGDDYGRPAYGGGGYGQPPPPAYGRAPPPAYGGGAGGGYGNVVHVAHEGGDERPHYGGSDERPHYGSGGVGGAYGGGGAGYGHETRPPYGGGGGGSAYGNETRPYGGGSGGSAYGNETHPYGGGSGGGAEPPARKPTYRIFCKAGNDQYSLAVRDGKVCLIRTNQDDDSQHWIKDLKYSTRVKDEEGYPAMILVNKATGEALKHSLGQSHPVRLSSYNPDYMDESVLWTESRDVGDGFRCIRMVNNIYLNFDALNGDKDHGGVRDGTTLVLWEWCEGDNQRWKIVPWCKFSSFSFAYD
ncbi:hypothetical protein QOZ80_1BG0055050 [Eleusine coracana subsp. coracana]|nr:hypothetical protein QOZ80_1BG0055050 [Eleusine coracana subsp. coracana]